MSTDCLEFPCAARADDEDYSFHFDEELFLRTHETPVLDVRKLNVLATAAIKYNLAERRQLRHSVLQRRLAVRLVSELIPDDYDDFSFLWSEELAPEQPLHDAFWYNSTLQDILVASYLVQEMTMSRRELAELRRDVLRLVDALFPKAIATRGFY